MKNDIAGDNWKIFLSEILENISVEKLNGFPFGPFEPAFEAQEGIILYVWLVFRLRRALSEAEEGVIWAISEKADV